MWVGGQVGRWVGGLVGQHDYDDDVQHVGLISSLQRVDRLVGC